MDGFGPQANSEDTAQIRYPLAGFHRKPAELSAAKTRKNDRSSHPWRFLITVDFVAKTYYICDKTFIMDSTEKRIMKIVKAGGEGKVYFPSDFFECGSDKAVSKALQRLVQADVMMRMERGLSIIKVLSQI